MKLGIMQPFFFPYIEYFQLINAVDKFILYGNIHFSCQTWFTRNFILCKSTCNPLLINVPVYERSCHKLVREVKIVDDLLWKKKMLLRIKFNYCKAAFYSEVYPVICELIEYKTDSLHVYVCNQITQLCKHLNIDTEIESDYQKYYPIEDMFKAVSQQEINIKTRRMIEICKKENCSNFINQIGGDKLYDKQLLRSFDIEINYLKMNSISYKQTHHAFVPNLSIIDVLMHNGFIGTKKLLEKYTLS